MKLVARILIFAMLAVFAAATTVHAAGTAAMDLKMAMAAAGGMDMDDRDGCGDTGDGTMACDPVCATPLLAIASPDADLRAAAPGIFDKVSAKGILGQTGPPNPYPPPSLILN
jgi:hypothetical protein